MTNNTINLSRELVSRLVGLEPNYTTAQLDADEETVRALLAEPAPPADDVNFDLDTMQKALAGKSVTMPEGLSREQFREWMKAQVEPACGDGHRAMLNQVAKAKAEMAEWPQSWRDSEGLEPVPPAGGEPEVPPQRRSWSGIASWKQRAEINAWNVACDAWEPHVTRLQAEVERLNSALSVTDAAAQKWLDDRTKLQAAQAEARELFDSILDNPRLVLGMPSALLVGIKDFLAHQSAPAAKPEDWHMNPCKQGHRDVGAAGGVAHCYTCDEKIEAATTQEAFERWNATHPQQ